MGSFFTGAIDSVKGFFSNGLSMVENAKETINSGIAGTVLDSVGSLIGGATDAMLKLVITILSKGLIIFGAIIACVLSFCTALMVGDDLGFSITHLKEVFFGETLFNSLCDSADFLAIALLLVFFFFVSLKTVFGPVSGARDTLKGVILRLMISIALLVTIRPSLYYVLDHFVNVLWEGNGDTIEGVQGLLANVTVGTVVSGSLSTAGSRLDEIGETLTGNPTLAQLEMDTAKILIAAVSNIIVMILAIIIIVMFVKLLIEAYARYLSMVMVIIFSPIACVGFVSEGTTQIFSKYMRMVFTQISVMFLTKMWLQITGTISISGDSMDIGTYVIIIAWVSAGLKIESYFRAVGLDVVQQGMGVANQMTMALFTASQFKKAGANMASGALMAGAASTGNMNLGKAGMFLSGKSTESSDVMKAMQQNPFARHSYNDNLKESIANAMQNPSREGYNAVNKVLSNLDAPGRQQALSDMANGLYGNAFGHIKGLKANGGGALSNMSFTDNGTLHGNVSLGKGMGTASITIADKPINNKDGQGLSFSFKDENGFEKYALIQGNGDYDPEKLSNSSFVPDINQDDVATTQEIAANSFAKDWNLDKSDVDDKEFAFNLDNEGNIESVESMDMDARGNLFGSDDQEATSESKIVGRFGEKNDFSRYDSNNPDAKWFAENGKFENLGLHEVSNFVQPEGTKNYFVGTAETETGQKIQVEMRQYMDGTKLEKGWKTYKAADGTKWDIKATRSEKQEK